MINGNIEDLKKTLTETIVSYALLIGILCMDFIINVLKVAGVPILAHENGAHPVSVGTVQIIMMLIILALMLARRIDERRYV